MLFPRVAHEPPTFDAPVPGPWWPALGIRPGARVEPGTLLGVIGAHEIESTGRGVVAALLVAPGAAVAVGQPLVRLVEPS